MKRDRDRLPETLADLYGPRVVQTPRAGSTLSLEESTGYKPTPNSRNADLLVADEKYGATVMAENRKYHEAILKNMTRK